MKHNTRIFGLTGNIGTGKSTVSWMFGELGVPIIDADDIARDALAPHSAAWKAIFERYGKSVLGPDGVIDRKTLAMIVFQDPAERKFLESITHPHVKAQIEREVADLAKQGHAFVIVEVPLLYEVGWQNDYDAVIVVRCNQGNEIKRCMEKFGMDREEVMLRFAAQYPLERKVAAADFVIDNDGPLEETRVQVNRLHQDMVKGRFPKA